MFNITSRLNKLSLCYRLSPATSHSISSSSPARKLTLEQKLGISPKPKKPMTAFFRFAQEFIRPTVLKDSPHLPVTQITKIASEKWKQADEGLKKKLTDDYQDDLKQYRIALEGYKEELARVDKETLKAFQIDIRTKKEKLKIKKLRSELGCPKKPPTSYFLYLQKRKNEQPAVPYRELVAAVTEEWKNLDPNEKALYQHKASSLKASYTEQMALWEREMRDSGNAEVLSPKKPKRSRDQ